jgi:hypothetical protein
MWLTNVLIFLFAGLICYQIILRHGVLREGMDSSGSYQSYDMSTNDVNVLSQQNAGNVQYLKSQIDDVSGNVATLSDQVQQLIQAQKDYTANSLPSTPPTISGTGATTS